MVCVLLVIGISAIPWLAELKIGASQAAVRRGDGAAAAAAALAARNLEPWASSPYLQLALVSEQAGSLRAARTWMDRALARDPGDWRLWLVAARIDTKLGRSEHARRELARAIQLNPRSPLFENLTP
jgi:Tfp pilus assembly protein PilF